MYKPVKNYKPTVICDQLKPNDAIVEGSGNLSSGSNTATLHPLVLIIITNNTVGMRVGVLGLRGYICVYNKSIEDHKIIR